MAGVPWGGGGASCAAQICWRQRWAMPEPPNPGGGPGWGVAEESLGKGRRRGRDPMGAHWAAAKRWGADGGVGLQTALNAPWGEGGVSPTVVLMVVMLGTPPGCPTPPQRSTGRPHRRSPLLGPHQPHSAAPGGAAQHPHPTPDVGGAPSLAAPPPPHAPGAAELPYPEWGGGWGRGGTAVPLVQHQPAPQVWGSAIYGASSQKPWHFLVWGPIPAPPPPPPPLGKCCPTQQFLRL